MQEFFKEYKDPSILLQPRNITFVADDNGDILHIGERSYGYGYAMIKDLSDAGNIRRFFGLKPEERISTIALEKRVLYSYSDQFEVSMGIDNFYSVMALFSLRFYPLAGNAYLGIILTSSILPNTFEKSSGIQFYLDEEGAILAFNQAFFNLFRQGDALPQSLFRRPIGELITPTPGELQARFLGGIGKPSAREWEGLYEHTFKAGKPAPLLEADSPEDILPGPEGLDWEARRPFGSFLTLTLPMDIEKKDVRVSLSIEPGSGPCPFIILGDRGAPGAYRDNNGYLLGFTEERFILKRQGFVVARSAPVSGEPLSEFSMIKAGNAFYGFHNSRERFAHYVFDRIERGPTHVILYLREGYRCRLRAFSVAAHPAPPREVHEDLLVQARGAEGKSFLINRFDNYSSAASVTGWRMQDVTELRRKASLLETRFRRELEESERLKRLLGRFSLDPDQPVGSSRVMARTLEMAGRASESSATVLLTGATGTGKEVLARYMHAHSPFQDGPFVKVDCSSIPQSLMESELFGHEKGAFTGAERAHEGLFERAEHGTLFIDEVGNLPMATQVKLLQVLQDFTVKRLGSAVQRRLSLRIIAATNANLEEQVQNGLFREDLYYRLAVVSISLPLLKERLDDLPELCQYFLGLFCRMNNKRIKGISSQAYSRLYAHPWPGNIRELKNVVERAVIFCDREEIQAGHISLEAGKSLPGRTGRKGKTAVHATREELEALLDRHKGVVLKAAEELLVSPRTLYYTFKKMGINPNQVRKNPHRRNAS